MVKKKTDAVAKLTRVDTLPLPGIPELAPRGRRAMFGVAMTAAERKRKSRAKAQTTSLELDLSLAAWIRREAVAQDCTVTQYLHFKLGYPKL